MYKRQVEQLREVLFTNAVRVIDLFRAWDDDGNGKIDEREFRRAIATLIDGSVPKHAAKDLYRQFDRDGSGGIDYAELNKVLRSGADVKLDKELQAGAKGKIETESKNKSTREKLVRPEGCLLYTSPSPRDS